MHLYFCIDIPEREHISHQKLALVDRPLPISEMVATAPIQQPPDLSPGVAHYFYFTMHVPFCLLALLHC